MAVRKITNNNNNNYDACLKIHLKQIAQFTFSSRQSSILGKQFDLKTALFSVAPALFHSQI